MKQFLIKNRNWLLPTSIALISFLAVCKVLSYPFTSIDTIPGIESGRIQSFSDFTSILTSSWLGGKPSTFAMTGTYFRPLTTLSYSLDYAIWGLSPFGYHLTDIVLHVFTAVMVYFLVRSLTQGRKMVAWTAALIFSFHPMLAEVVPTTERRNEVLVTLLLIFTLLLLKKYLESPSKKLMAATVIIYFLALTSKEVAIIFPALAFTFIMIFSFSAFSVRKRAWAGLKICVPFLIASIVMLAWRTYVLGGLFGNYSKPRSDEAYFKHVRFYGSLFKDYVLDLFSAGGVAGFLRPHPGVISYMIAALLVLLLIFYIWFSRRDFLTYFRKHDGLPLILRIVLGSISLALLICLAAFPWFARFITSFISDVYYNQTIDIVYRLNLGIGQWLPLDTFLYETRNVIVNIFAFLFLASTAAIIINHHRSAVKRYLRTTESGNVLLFFFIWILLPLTFFAFSGSFGHRYMYIALVPFSGLISIILIDGMAAYFGKSDFSSLSNFFLRSGFTFRQVINFCMIFLVVGGLTFIPTSLVFRRYGEWEATGKVYSMILEKLSSQITTIPDGATIYIDNVPSRLYLYENQYYHPEEVQYMSEEAMRSWLYLKFPDKHLDVAYETIILSDCPQSIDLVQRNLSGNNVEFAVIYNFSNPS